MFEAVYQDLEERIADSTKQLDPMTAEPEFLSWLAKWVGISNAHLWQEDRLRILLEGIVRKNLIRGTRDAESPENNLSDRTIGSPATNTFLWHDTA